MRILILGGDGMLGHQLANSLSSSHDVHVTLRGMPRNLPSPLAATRPHWAIEALDWLTVEHTISSVAPDAVINAIGVIKQRATHSDAILNISLNALLPHRLAEFCQKVGVRLVHFSTDCIFSGDKGSYREDDFPDAKDLYGRTKFLGEVGGDGVFTLRTSIIGLELARKASLIEWFLSQREEIKGFARAIYSGFTTLEMARIVAIVLAAPSSLGGIYNVSSEPISKYDLLMKLTEVLALPVNIVREETFNCDRSLLSPRFREQFNYTPPSWAEMIDELAAQIRERYP